MTKLLVYVFLLFGLTQAFAHESSTGWQYPAECCHDRDCGEILDMVVNDDGSMTVTTKHGTATFPKDYPVKTPGDNKNHACFMNYDGTTILYCLFLHTYS
jgi:hypothetical protein